MSNLYNTTGNGGPTITNQTVSSKSRVAAALLCFFLGEIGIHRFYAGKIGTGIAMLMLSIIGWLTTAIVIGFVILAVCGIWWLVDFIVILTGGFKDSDGLPIK